MKRQHLLEHIRRHGCVVVREGGGHTKVYNPANRRRSVVPRHREINTDLMLAICKHLGIPAPGGR